MKQGIIIALLMMLLIPVLSCEDSNVTPPEDLFILLSAEPDTIVPTGILPDPDYGETIITAKVVDSSHIPVKGVGVIFSASPLGSEGSLASAGSPVKTDSNGRASDVLKNNQDTAVTATTRGITAEIDIPFVFDNVLPSANIVAEPNPALVNSWVAFDGTRSRDEDGEIVNYIWEFWYDHPCDPEEIQVRPIDDPDDAVEGYDAYVIVKQFDHEQDVIVILTVTDNMGADDDVGHCQEILTVLPPG